MPFALLIIDEVSADAEKKRFCSREDEDHEMVFAEKERNSREELRNNFKCGTKKEKKGAFVPPMEFL